jgi:hypothetical protein
MWYKLNKQGLELIQALGGNRWTDFNAHDPGVTILEACHYALLELNYSLELPFESYLAEKDEAGYSSHGLFPAYEITAPSIVTASDYEQLIKAKIKQAKDCRVNLAENHTYHILVEAEKGADKVVLGRRIIELYHAHRNLGETLGKVSFGKPDIPPDDSPEAYDYPEFGQQQQDTDKPPVFSDAFHSLQNHFPDCYGVNGKGIPAGASSVRKAQILQLQAYLLIFDYMIANVQRQAGTIPALLELSKKIPTSVPPDLFFPDVEKLVDMERLHANSLPDSEYWHLQKSRVLDCLDMIYGEDTKKWVASEPDLPAKNGKRARLIRHLPQLNANRFRSFNILTNGQHALSGIAQWAEEVFGHAPCLIEHILLSGNEDDHNLLTLVNHEQQFDEDERTNYEVLAGERLPAHLQVRFVWMDDSRIPLFNALHHSWRKAMMIRNIKEIDRCSREIRKLLKEMPE